MGLVNLTTNLKSLRYGKDTVGGRNSNQPYVTTKIPESFSKVGKTGGPDFLLRGGTLLPKIVANDVSRLTQMFFDFKSPTGPLFIAKQNVLSLTNVNSSKGYIPYKQEESSTVSSVLSAIGSFIQDNLAMNQGAYTPLGTLAQAAGNSIGLHTNKQGINPLAGIGGPGATGIVGAISNFDPLGLPTYLSTISTGGDEGNKSRLFGLLNKIDEKQDDPNALYSYTGGPGATLGVGKTNIVMVGDQRTGINNVFNGQLQFNTNFNNNISNSRVGDTTFEYTPRPVPNGIDPRSLSLQEIVELNTTETTPRSVNYIPSIYNPGLRKNKNITNKAGVSDIKFGYGATTKYVSLLDPKRQTEYFENEILFNSGDIISPISFTRNVYKPGTLTTNEDKLKSGIKKSIPRQVWTQEEIEAKDSFSQTNKADNITDFRKKINSDNLIPNTLPYTNNNKFEQRVNLGNPGRKGNLSSYSIGKRIIPPLNNPVTPNTKKGNSDYTHALDKINAYPLYKSTEVTGDRTKNDFVKFRIGVIDNQNPSKKTYIHFRAIIDNMSDSYTAEWASQKYMGRAENFYKYQGFDRKISLSWTVAAQSKQELIPMYQKLNYLASSCAPSYSEAGYMSGNLISLTIGGWCFEQVGIIGGLTLDVPTESPWEIAIPDGLDGGTVGEGENTISSDNSVKEMPMIIKVTGFTFTPIHNFRPELQKNDYEGSGGFISKYGEQRYIALENKFNNNYDEPGKNGNDNFNYIPQKVN